MITSQENWSDFKKQEVIIPFNQDLEFCLQFCGSSNQSHLGNGMSTSRLKLAAYADLMFIPLPVAGASPICPSA